MNLAAIRARVYDRLDEEPSDPQRWPESVVTEYLNDGLQLLISRARLKVKTATITQLPETLYYPLPADCIAVLAIYDNQFDRPVELTSWRELDRLLLPGFFRPDTLERLRQRWSRSFNTYATHAFVYGLNELALWPMLGPAEVTDDVAFSDGFIGDNVQTSFDLSVGPGGVGVWWNGVRLQKVNAAPSAIQYTASGSTVTIGAAPALGNQILSTVSALSGFIVGETPGGVLDGANDVLTLAATPSSPSAVALYLNGVRLNNAGILPSGGITALAHGAFISSGNQLQLRDPPLAGQTLYADYTTDADNVVIGEQPEGAYNGFNRDFLLAEQPSAFAEVAVFVSGVRLSRTNGHPGVGQFLLAGRTLHVGTAPLATTALYVDYIRIPLSSNRSYTIHYLEDVPEDVSADTDEPDVPVSFHETLADYVVARCLLPKARGERVKRAADMLSRFNSSVEQARQHNRNVALNPSVNGQASYGPTGAGVYV